jgi:broad specificity phosphatase PhoE
VSVLRLVRHGQASFGASDYDALSELGHEQARLLGRALAARGTVPDLIVRGDLRRHRETAVGIAEGLGHDVPVDVDACWDEFDFGHVIDVHQSSGEAPRLVPEDLAGLTPGEQRARFQGLFEEATARWTGGAAAGEYAESFPAFASRVGSAVERAAATGGSSVLVVSSGGPIALVASQLVSGGPALWASLNRVAVNTAVTKVISGRAGLTLSTYNTHDHLEHDRALITYR